MTALSFTKLASVISLFASCLFIAAPVSAIAATVPAGTVLSVRTQSSVLSRTTVGRTFKAHLDRDVAVSGKVVLKAGTQVAGRVDSSPTDPRRSRPFTLNVTAVSVHGHMVPIKTVRGFDVHPQGWKTQHRGISVSGGEFVAPAGTMMQFKLAEPFHTEA